MFKAFSCKAKLSQRLTDFRHLVFTHVLWVTEQLTAINECHGVINENMQRMKIDMTDIITVTAILAAHHDPSNNVCFLDPALVSIFWVFRVGFINPSKTSEHIRRQHLKIHGTAGYLIKALINRAL